MEGDQALLILFMESLLIKGFLDVIVIGSSALGS